MGTWWSNGGGWVSLGSKEEAEGEVAASQAELCGAGEQLAGIQSGGW